MSLFAVKAAVAEAVMRFNLREQEPSSHILREPHLEQTCIGSQRAAEKNNCHAVGPDKKRASSAAFQAAARKHKQNPVSD